MLRLVEDLGGRALLDDAALLAQGRSPSEAVAEHREHRAAAYAPLVGPLVVPDTQLAEVGRHHRDGPELAVQVVNSGGAGGVLGLSRRSQPGLEVVSVISMLRDLDDLAGNAARVIAAAEALDPDVTVFVGLPYAPGWPRAVELVEAGGVFHGIQLWVNLPGRQKMTAPAYQNLEGSDVVLLSSADGGASGVK